MGDGLTTDSVAARGTGYASRVDSIAIRELVTRGLLLMFQGHVQRTASPKKPIDLKKLSEDLDKANREYKQMRHQMDSTRTYRANIEWRLQVRAEMQKTEKELANEMQEQQRAKIVSEDVDFSLGQ